MSGDVQVLARIRADLWLGRPKAYKDEVRAWLRANGVDPDEIPVRRDVEIVLLDGPAIVREEYLLDEQGLRQWRDNGDGWRDPVTRVVASLLRVPLPEHLADPA